MYALVDTERCLLRMGVDPCLDVRPGPDVNPCTLVRRANPPSGPPNVAGCRPGESWDAAHQESECRAQDQEDRDDGTKNVPAFGT
jgi:hypothetical protein